jgi:ATP-binding cassette, subfamily B, bacterial MsbA
MDAANTLPDAEAAESGTTVRPESAPRAVVATGAQMPLSAAARRLGRYARPYAGALALGIVLFLAGGALDPLLPLLFQQLIDSGFGTRGAAWFPLWAAPVAIVVLFGVRGLITFTATVVFARATSKIVLALRKDLTAALLRADAPLYAQISPGVAANRVIHDPHNAATSVAGAMTTLLRDGATLIGLLAYLFWLDWRLAFISLTIVPILAFVVQRVQRRILAVSGRSYESMVRLTGIVDDIARAWRVVRSFDAGKFEAARFEREAEHLRRATLKVATAGASMTPLTQLIASVGVAVIVGLALTSAAQGGVTVGGFVAFITALLMTISPLKHLSDLSQPIIGGLVVARACFALIDSPPERDSGDLDIPGRASGELTLEDVTVRYPASEAKALDGVTLHVPAGSTVALVGASGAGKSTLVNTLLGFVAPEQGRLQLDGHPLARVRKASLRQQFAVVSQDTVLFDTTIADNVAYALPRDDTRVWACLEAANLADFVHSLPQGMHTIVGVDASRLSGGQRQRLAIARALYKDAPVWILDEATSALDGDSEREVHAALDRWRGQRTLLLVAHRLSTVRRADNIVVFDHGRVVEQGSHDALVARGGRYAAMAALQHTA